MTTDLEYRILFEAVTPRTHAVRCLSKSACTFFKMPLHVSFLEGMFTLAGLEPRMSEARENNDLWVVEITDDYKVIQEEASPRQIGLAWLHDIKPGSLR